MNSWPIWMRMPIALTSDPRASAAPSLSRTVTYGVPRLALARGSEVNAIGIRIQIGQLLHFPTIPKSPRSRPRHRDTIDEVNRPDGNYRKGQAKH